MDWITMDVLPAVVAPEVVAHHLGGLLSDRELEVAKLAVSGMSTAEMAKHLFVTLNTVKTHIRHILRKTGAANRTDLMKRLLDLERGADEGNVLLTDPYVAERDPMTGLPYRSAFDRRASELLVAGGGHGLSVLVLKMDGRADLSFVDLVVLDMAVTEVLTAAVPPADLVFRWEEDQFLALLPGMDREGARAVGMRLAICLGQWAQKNGYDLLFSVSSASSHEGIASAAELVRVAESRQDLALRDSA